MIKRVYVAGPYTKGDVVINVRNACEAGTKLVEAGYSAFVPHLSHLWHTVTPRPWSFWMNIDYEWLTVCHYLLRLPGESTGADLEVEAAKAAGIPCFFGTAEEFILAHADKQ